MWTDDIGIINVTWIFRERTCVAYQINFLDQEFQKMHHYTQSDATDNVNKAHSRVVIIVFRRSIKITWFNQIRGLPTST